MICSASRYLMVAWLVGVVAASVTGSEPMAWAAAAAAVALTYAVTRWGPQRFRASSCAVPSSAGATNRMPRRQEPVAGEAEPARSLVSSAQQSASSGR